MSDMTIPEFDLREQQFKHEQEMQRRRDIEAAADRKNRLRIARQPTYQLIGGLFLATVAFLTVVILIAHPWYHKPPSKGNGSVEFQREQVCYANGGGWVPKDLFRDYADKQGLCVYPGKRATQ